MREIDIHIGAETLSPHFCLPFQCRSTLKGNFARVATVREKYLENEIFYRSGKSKGILLMGREIRKDLKSGKSQGI